MEKKASFEHFDLTLLKPSFESELTTLVVELEGLRSKVLKGTTRPFMFFQIKEIFHILESLGSARIEGNNTTIAEIVENRINESKSSTSDKLREIENVLEAMTYIDEVIDGGPINNDFIKRLHSLVVKDLSLPPDGEGDITPGAFRNYGVMIKKSGHKPPDIPAQIEVYMEELVAFIQRDDLPKYDLIKTALAHHRFMWIHPFGNGNGRTGRLLTYAVLVKMGFNIKKGKLINPTAIFCLNRDLYNANLALADTGSIDGLTNWCEFVLRGLKIEIEKIDRLVDVAYFRNEIVLPSLKISQERKLITSREENILKRTIGSDSQTITNSEIRKDVLKRSVTTQQVSNIIRGLVDKKMLSPIEEGSRRYYLRFDNNYLLRGVMQVLKEKGFVSIPD